MYEQITQYMSICR